MGIGLVERRSPVRRRRDARARLRRQRAFAGGGGRAAHRTRTPIMKPTPTRTIDIAKAQAEHAREILRREWLLTNGLGGYASGTICGMVTRRYHGLLIAALPAPFG